MTDDDRSPTHGDDDASLEFAAPVKLTALRAEHDAPRFDAAIRSIAAAAVAERARVVNAAPLQLQGDSRRWGGTLAAVAAWSRPALAAAVLVFIVSAATLLFAPTPASAAPRSMAESAGIPGAFVVWATTARAPTAADIVDVFDVGVAPDTTRRAP